MIQVLKGKKILFTTIPVDGSINSLTGLVNCLEQLGCSILWYNTAAKMIPLGEASVGRVPEEKQNEKSGNGSDQGEYAKLSGLIREVMYKMIIHLTTDQLRKDLPGALDHILEAFQHTDTLVAAVTSAEIHEDDRLYQQNVMMEGIIPYNLYTTNNLYTSVYVLVGGYTGTPLSIRHKLSMISTKLARRKNDICYFNFVINLQTGLPAPAELKKKRRIYNQNQPNEVITGLIERSFQKQAYMLKNLYDTTAHDSR